MELGEVAMMDLLERDRAIRTLALFHHHGACFGEHGKYLQAGNAAAITATSTDADQGILGVRPSKQDQAKRKKIAPAMRRFAQRGHLSQSRLPFVSSDNLILSR